MPRRSAGCPSLPPGEAIGTFALGERAGQPRPDTLATRAANGRLTGAKMPVADGDVADSRS